MARSGTCHASLSDKTEPECISSANRVRYKGECINTSYELKFDEWNYVDLDISGVKQPVSALIC